MPGVSRPSKIEFFLYLEEKRPIYQELTSYCDLTRFAVFLGTFFHKHSQQHEANEMRFIKANEVDRNASSEVRYNRGQLARCSITGKLYSLRGFRANGDHVWVEVNPSAPRPRFRVLKARPQFKRNPYGILTVRGKERRNMSSRPLAPLSYRIGVRA